VGGGRGGHKAACELYGLAGTANMPMLKALVTVERMFTEPAAH